MFGSREVAPQRQAHGSPGARMVARGGLRALVVLVVIGSWFVGVTAEAQDPPVAPVAPAGAAGTGAPAPGGSSVFDDETPEEAAQRVKAEFNRELLTAEQDTTRLKERVFRSKATLQLLRKLVLDGLNLGSRVVLFHENRMGAAYELESVQYFLDGKNVMSRTGQSGDLDSEREFQIIDQALTPGPHNLQVGYVLRGSGFGVFSYLRSYSFKVQSSYGFTVEAGKQLELRVIANEKGGPWRTFVDWPTVEYEVTTARMENDE